MKKNKFMKFTKILDKYNKWKNPVEPNSDQELSSQTEDEGVFGDDSVDNQPPTNSEVVVTDDVSSEMIDQKQIIEGGSEVGDSVTEGDVHRQSPWYSTDVRKFFGKDWRGIGRRDGYKFHSSQYFKNMKWSIIHEFQKLCEYRIDELKEERLNCSGIIIDIGDISTQINDKFVLRINMLDEYIEDFKREKELSESSGGIIRSVISEYGVGWEMGVSEYLLENHFLNPPKRL